MALFTLDDALDFMDQQDEYWKKYRVGVTERHELNGWVLEPFEIPRESIGRLRMLRDGLDRDTGWGDGFTALRHNGEIWMSDTRAEIMEHTPLINKLWWTEHIPGKTVLINGLGIGMAIRACLAHNIEHVDVVEIEQDVIDLVAPLFEGEPVTFHQGDAYEIQWPRGTSWDFAWHDIWPTISDDNLDGMRRLHRKYRRKVAWQDSWQYKGCLALARKTKKFEAALRANDWATVKKLDPDF